jgi:hypothetical protein
MKDNKLAVIGLVVVVALAVGALFFVMKGQGSGESAADIKAIQAEAAKDVPAGLEPVSPEMNKDLVSIGGPGKK